MSGLFRIPLWGHTGEKEKECRLPGGWKRKGGWARLTSAAKDSVKDIGHVIRSIGEASIVRILHCTRPTSRLVSIHLTR